MTDDADDYDDDYDDDDVEERSYSSQEYGSVDSMMFAVRRYLADSEMVERPLSEEEINQTLAKPEAQTAISRAVSLGSFAYWAGDQVYNLARSES